jgi:hypothetical protein
MLKNVILASADQVAIDAVAAKLTGIDPMSITFVRIAHEMALGCGGPRDIEGVGDTSAAAESPWGRLCRNWETVQPDAAGLGYPDVGGNTATIEKTGVRALVQCPGILGTCIKEAPEFANRRRNGSR